nr:MAG: ORF1 [TTV-like mini virus]
MAPYKRRWNWNKRWRWRRRRFPYRRRRPKTTFRRRKKTFWVRKYFYKRNRKLKKLKLLQYQPNSIKKCHIKGFLPLFQCGNGRQENNYAMYKDSYTPEHEPGGGGWSIQKLSLGILYSLNNDIQNVWTKSNYRLPLCRYLGCTIRCYRQPYTDYIVHYFHDAPRIVPKYYYASFHPTKLLELQNKKIVPSFNTQPHKKKPYVKIKVPPPKLMENKWFFQQYFADHTLIHLAASAISLTNMYGSDRAENNNASFYTLNTTFFQNPYVNLQQPITANYGYHPNSSNYLWGLSKAQTPFTNNKRQDAIYLGNSTINEPGTEAAENTYNSAGHWGNPFHWEYLTGDSITFITTATQDPQTWLTATTKNRALEATQERTTPNIITVRYNPYKDKGKGNKVYFIPNNSPTHRTWEPTSDPDLMFENFPLWIMLWGIEDIVQRMGKAPNINENWLLVIQSKYLSENEPYYVPLSWNYVHGQGPYAIDRSEIPASYHAKWFPKFKFQKEAIHDIVMTGPAVIRPDHVKNFQAIIHYNFFFKWGGNPSTLENVYDPNSQPGPSTANYLNGPNEIINPETDFRTFLYQWDTRRDYLTQTAAERITESSIHDYSLFTDGKQTSTDVPLFPQETQKKTTPKAQTETLLQQLKQLQQFNKLLQQRFNLLNISLEDL